MKVLQIKNTYFIKPDLIESFSAGEILLPSLAMPIHAKKNQIYVSDFIKYNMVFLNFRYSLKLNAIKDFEFNDFDKCSMTISNVVVLFDSSIVYSIKKNPKYLQFKTLESLNKIFNKIGAF